MRLNVSQLECTCGIPLSCHCMRRRLPCTVPSPTGSEEGARDGETGNPMQLASIKRAATPDRTTIAVTQRYALCCSSPFEGPEEHHTNIPRVYLLYEGEFA